MSDVPAVDVPVTLATDWPTIEDMEAFTGVSAANDPMLQVALDAAISYGASTLGDRYVGPINGSIFRGCMDYAGSIYTERIGQADVTVETYFGSTPLTRYRKLLLTSRFTALA